MQTKVQSEPFGDETEWLEVQAIAELGHLFLHRTLLASRESAVGMTISHQPTGLAVFHYFVDEATALKALIKLSALDWSFTDPARAEALKPDVFRILRSCGVRLPVHQCEQKRNVHEFGR